MVPHPFPFLLPFLLYPLPHLTILALSLVYLISPLTYNVLTYNTDYIMLYGCTPVLFFTTFQVPLLLLAYANPALNLSINSLTINNQVYPLVPQHPNLFHPLMEMVL